MLTVAPPKPLAGPYDAPLRAAKVTPELQHAIEQFLYRQAECLDTRRWQDYIDRFAADGIYWMPAQPEQTTGDGEPSIFYEDHDLMTIRLKRLGHPHAWSQQTEWGLSHVVGNVIIERHDPAAGIVECRSRFQMMEFRRDVVRQFAGSYLHHLRQVGDGWKIVLQRVDMVNGAAPYEYVLQAWV